MENKTIRIALAGNPNCGKTTLFNALTGSNQFVGNWPGVTVEKKEGKLKKHDDVIITDLAPTAISKVENAAADGKIYTIAGVQVKKATKGFYIINGKKCLVK